MNTEEVLFYSTAVILFSTLIYRIVKARSVPGGIPFYLFLFLYAGLFAYPFVQAAAPKWLQGFNWILFLTGEIWFLGEMLGQAWHPKYELKSQLKELKKEKGGFYELVRASHLLSQARMGALIAIERKKPLVEWYQKGIGVDATLSREILYSVFTPPGALHDGGAIIRKNRLMACGVIFPLTQTANFPKELGTRHRAAVGFSEVTDALCIIVSEESGSISIADRGSLYYDIPIEKLPGLLEQALRFRLKKNKSLVQTYELVKT